MQTIKGVVVRGRGVGRKFGVPTANIKLDKNFKIPESGVAPLRRSLSAEDCGEYCAPQSPNGRLRRSGEILELGVFSGFIYINKKKYKAAIFIGPRLTFNLSEQVIEAAIIDFSGDLYDNEIELEIKKKIRDIKKFSSVEELKKQIMKDIEQVKNS
ncbi:MAG: riboflavin kinase [bacterium]